MRILTILTSLGIGGAEKQALRIAEGMAARGNEVLLLVLLPAQRHQWPTSLRTIHLGLHKSPLSALRGIFRARRILADFKPHIAHSHTFHANLFARFLKLPGANCKLVSTIHNVYEGGSLRMLAYRVTDFLCIQTTAVSSAAAKRFVRLSAVPAEKMRVLTNGIDSEEFSPARLGRVISRQGGEFHWLAAGRITPAKDYSNLLHAFSLVRAAEPSTRLLIAGDGSDAEKTSLIALAHQLGIAAAINWLGLRDDLPQLMAGADAFVLSSAWEGMPLVVGEAMAMELPVVATGVGGVHELTGECALIVPPHEPAALASSMLAVQRMTPEARQTLGQSARARILAHFNLKSRVGEWADLYVDLFHNSKPSPLRAPLLTALAARLILLLFTLMRTGISIITGGDTFSYLLPGLNLLHKDCFFNLRGPELDRTPGYPLFLAIATAPGFLFAMFFQIAISIASIWLTARIAGRIFAAHPRKNQIAVLAAWLMAFDPLSCAYSIKLYPETIFVFLLLLAIDRLLQFIESKHPAVLAQAAMILAAAIYCKPIAYYLPIFLAAWLLFQFRKTPRLRSEAPLLLLLLAAALLAPWQLRNWRIADFNGFSTVQQKNLYFFEAAGVLAQAEDRPFEQVQKSLGYGGRAGYFVAHPEQSDWPQSAIAAYQGREAMRILATHPFVSASLQLKGSAIIALTPGTADLFDLLGAAPRNAASHLANLNLLATAWRFARGNPSHFVVMLLAFTYLLWLLVNAARALCNPQIPHHAKALFIIFALYLLLLSGGAQAVARYRLPLMPLLCILAAGNSGFTRINWVSRGPDAPISVAR